MTMPSGRLTAIALCVAAFAPGAVRPLGATTAADEATSYRAVLDKYCVTCHNQRLRVAGLTLDRADVGRIGDAPDVWEKVVRKMRSSAMPPPGRPRPDGATYSGMTAWLERELDRAAAMHPDPGGPQLHRLNRTEYANAVRDLFGLDIDAAALLPPDNAGYGFDNIADVLSSSPALTERYLSAAAKVSQMAIGRIKGSPTPDTFTVSTDLDQQGRVSEDLPFGSRGGLAVRYFFPVDGEYLFTIRLHETAAGMRGFSSEPGRLEGRIDGAKTWSGAVGPPPKAAATGAGGPSAPVAERRAVGVQRLDDGLEFRAPVKAGTHLVQIYFVQETTAYLEDLIDPDLRSKSLPNDTTGEAAVSTVTVTGPFNAGGASDSPSRRRVFVCQPSADGRDDACARRIIARVARRAYRRPVTAHELADVYALYRTTAMRGGVDAGIEIALRTLLVSPEFLFRVERQPAGVPPGTVFRVSDLELASRLSFFLWSSIPDDELLDVAVAGQLHTPAVLDRQIRRLLQDERSRALVENFFGQWLHVRNVASARPSPELFFEFDDNLRQAFRQETELFAASILREDRSLLDLLDAPYTFLNERLARHYGIPGVYGGQFRRVELPADSVRRGILGQGAVLTVSSYANRTSPVLRGKWILENILGTPPPPPPPNVPELKETGDAGQVLPMRERMAQHRANPVCAGCHSQMDPLGFALENFDAVGKWRREDESALAIDASGVLPDGSRFVGPAELRQKLLDRSEQFVGTFVEKLLTYALGRGLVPADQPSVRHVVRRTAGTKYRVGDVIAAIVQSAPFQMSKTKGL